MRQRTGLGQPIDFDQYFAADQCVEGSLDARRQWGSIRPASSQRSIIRPATGLMVQQGDEHGRDAEQPGGVVSFHSLPHRGGTKA